MNRREAIQSCLALPVMGTPELTFSKAVSGYLKLEELRFKHIFIFPENDHCLEEVLYSSASENLEGLLDYLAGIATGFTIRNGPKILFAMDSYSISLPKEANCTGTKSRGIRKRLVREELEKIKWQAGYTIEHRGLVGQGLPKKEWSDKMSIWAITVVY